MIGEAFLQRLLAHLRAAERETAQAVAAAARANTPKASGQLAASITAEENEIRASAPYAAAVEFRTPYLRPALLAKGAEFKRRITAKE
jgi:hypothetical protein